MRKNQKNKTRSGFTMIEIMMVLVIMVSMAAVGVMAFGQIRNGANQKLAQTRVQELTKALELYMVNVGTYPGSDEGLQSLVACPQSVSNPDNWVKVLDVVPNDPWGQPLQYQYPSSHKEDGFDLWSCGLDQVSGTDDDITNWK